MARRDFVGEAPNARLDAASHGQVRSVFLKKTSGGRVQGPFPMSRFPLRWVRREALFVRGEVRDLRRCVGRSRAA